MAVLLVLWFFRLRNRPAPVPAAATAPAASLAFPGEKHLANIRQVTFGGQNAEAYFSADDKQLIFQHQGQFYDPQTHAPVGTELSCDQMYRDRAGFAQCDAEVGQQRRGAHNLRLFLPGRRSHPVFVDVCGRSGLPTAAADYSQGYVWPIYDTYSIYTARPDGSDIQPLAKMKGYDASRRFRATANMSCSRPREMAISISTR